MFDCAKFGYLIFLYLCSQTNKRSEYKYSKENRNDFI